MQHVQKPLASMSEIYDSERMQLALRLKDDLVALMEHFKRQCADEWSDTGISKAAVNDRNFIITLMRWDGGPQSPTLERVAKFEDWLRTQLGEKEYQSFRKERAKQIAG